MGNGINFLLDLYWKRREKEDPAAHHGGGVRKGGSPQLRPGLLTLYLGLLCWSNSASRISSVSWAFVFHLFCCSLDCLNGG